MFPFSFYAVVEDRVVPGVPPNVVIPTPSIRITRSLRVPAALSVEELLLVGYVISGIAVQNCVMYERLVAFTAYLKPYVKRSLYSTTIAAEFPGNEKSRVVIPV